MKFDTFVRTTKKVLLVTGAFSVFGATTFVAGVAVGSFATWSAQAKGLMKPMPSPKYYDGTGLTHPGMHWDPETDTTQRELIAVEHARKIVRRHINRAFPEALADPSVVSGKTMVNDLGWSVAMRWLVDGAEKDIWHTVELNFVTGVVDVTREEEA